MRFDPIFLDHHEQYLLKGWPKPSAAYREMKIRNVDLFRVLNSFPRPLTTTAEMLKRFLCIPHSLGCIHIRVIGLKVNMSFR